MTTARVHDPSWPMTATWKSEMIPVIGLKSSHGARPPTSDFGYMIGVA